MPSHPPVFIVHSLAHAVAVLREAAAAGRAVVLASAPGAGIYAGPGWFGAVAEAARAAVPEAEFSALLDCGDDAGAAMAAIRAGIGAVVFTGRTDVAERLTEIAAERGCRLLTDPLPEATDLGALFFADEETLRRHCREILAGPASR